MSFSFPWLLVLLPAALFFLRKSGARPIAVSSLAGWRGALPSWRIRWRGRLRFLYAAAVALLLLAMAGPRIERKVVEEVRQGIAMELLFDLSSSMDQNITAADGSKITRMEAGKKVLEDFIRKRRDDLIGLIVFARYADTLCPLTFGHDALVEIVRGLAIQDRPNEDGTAYGDALSIACARLRQIDELKNREGDKTSAQVGAIQSKVVVLFTDGENNCGLHLPQEAAGLAKKWGIRIYSISMESSGSPAPGGEPDGEFTDAQKLLRRISAETGGEFWTIHDAAQIAEVYTAIDRLEKSRLRNTTVSRAEHVQLFPWLVLSALFLLLLGQVLDITILRVAEEVGI